MFSPASHIQRRCLQIFNERLCIKPLAGGLVKRIGKCSHHRWKGRFTQTCWINIILHKMNINSFRCFAMAYHAVLVEVTLVGGSFGERQSAVHELADPVNTSTYYKISGGS